MSPKTLSFIQTFNAAATEVYRAFTNGTTMRGWLCDACEVVPHPHGRLYLYWNDGYYANGEFISLELPSKVVFSWRGRTDPGETQITLTITAQDGTSQLAIEHSGFGDTPEWERTFSEIERGWQVALENLKSVLETDQDLRFTRRPMLGITLSDFDAAIAQKLGVPVNEGIRLDGVMEGMGAQAAGLQKNDVIVGLAGQDASDYNSFIAIIQSHRAGDKIEVVFYRGPEKKSVLMELSPRPMPEVPATQIALAEAVGKQDAECETGLDKFLAEIIEAEASVPPAPGEWSVKGVLAHLIHSEGYWQTMITEAVIGQEAYYDDYTANLQARVEATLVVYPTIVELRAALHRAMMETVQLIAHLPAEFVTHKRSYWQLAYNCVQYNTHFFGHLEQMKAAVAAARKS